MTRPARIVLAAAVTSAVLLSACGKHDKDAGQQPAAASTAAPATPPPTAPAPASSAPAHTASAPAAAATTAQAPAAAPTPAASADDTAFKVGGVQLGDAVTASHKVSKAKTSFEPSVKAIYASVATTGKTDGATLAAQWRYLDNGGQQVSTISQTIATDGPATTTFKVANPSPWPAGKYKVDISLNGKPVSSQNFEIKPAST